MKYQVEVIVEGNEPETHSVEAADEWKARTIAMMYYGQPLAGQLVTYHVVPVHKEWKRYALNETLTPEGASTILSATNESAEDLRKHKVVAIHLWEEAVFIYEYPNQEFWTLDGTAECLGTLHECMTFLENSGYVE